MASTVSTLIWIGLGWKNYNKCVIGLAKDVASYLSIIFLKERLSIDNALDVSSVHGIPGIIGSLPIEFFTSSLINSAGPNRLLLFGSPHQLLIQAISVDVATVSMVLEEFS